MTPALLNASIQKRCSALTSIPPNGEPIARLTFDAPLFNGEATMTRFRISDFEL
jgi:hypothetical protein